MRCITATNVYDSINSAAEMHIMGLIPHNTYQKNVQNNINNHRSLIMSGDHIPEYKNRDKLNTFIGIRLTVFSILYAIHHIIVNHH